jgi:hypothetical protein
MSKLPPLKLPPDLSDSQNGQTNAVLTIQPNHQLAFAILLPFVYRCVNLQDRFTLNQQVGSWTLIKCAFSEIDPKARHASLDNQRTCWQFANLTFVRPQVCLLTAKQMSLVTLAVPACDPSRPMQIIIGILYSPRGDRQHHAKDGTVRLICANPQSAAMGIDY